MIGRAWPKAPRVPQVCAAYWALSAAACSSDAPVRIRQTSRLANASPAPRVSTASTGIAGANSTFPLWQTVAPRAPWVTVTRHKDGTAPSGSVVRNNVMMRVFRKRQDGGGHKFDLHQTGVSVRDNLELDPSDVQASVSPDGSVDIPDYAPGKTIGARYLIPDAN